MSLTSSPKSADICGIPPRPGGAYALSSRNARRGCGGRDDVSAQFFARTTDISADGEVVWSWHPDADAKRAERSARDGGKKARSPGRARRTPLKPSRREGRTARPNLW